MSGLKGLNYATIGLNTLQATVSIVKRTETLNHNTANIVPIDFSFVKQLLCTTLVCTQFFSKDYVCVVRSETETPPKIALFPSSAAAA